ASHPPSLHDALPISYRRWAHNQRNPPVAVILMASFAEDLQRTIPRSVGIAYEVPVVTSVVGLRSLGTSVKRIGVVHRAGFSDYVHTQARLAAVEHITFISEVLPEDPDVRRS